jgi:hypothetical protein
MNSAFSLSHALDFVGKDVGSQIGKVSLELCRKFIPLANIGEIC